jgi:hypothetical protein
VIGGLEPKMFSPIPDKSEGLEWPCPSSRQKNWRRSFYQNRIGTSFRTIGGKLIWRSLFRHGFIPDRFVSFCPLNLAQVPIVFTTSRPLGCTTTDHCPKGIESTMERP